MESDAHDRGMQNNQGPEGLGRMEGEILEGRSSVVLKAQRELPSTSEPMLQRDAIVGHA